jgi:hypothetical protein
MADEKMSDADRITAELEGLDFGDEHQDDTGSTDDAVQTAGDDAASKEIERKARDKGWLPKAEFSKDPATWVDAKTFVERGEKFTSNLQKEVSQLKRQLDQFKGTAEAFKKFHEESIAAKQRDLDATILELRKAKIEATRDGDAEQVIKLEDRIELAQAQKKEVKAIPLDAAGDPPILDNPIMDAWVADDNQWFHEDKKLGLYAVAVGKDLLANGEPLRNRAFLDKVADIVRADFPEKFKPKQTSGSVSSSSSRQTSSSGKTERDLPKADQELMREFIAAGYVTKEQFLKDYWSRNA